jgi:hypothetical protein
LLPSRCIVTAHKALLDLHPCTTILLPLPKQNPSITDLTIPALVPPAAATAKAKHIVDTYTSIEGVVKAHIDNSVQKRVDALGAMLGEAARMPTYISLGVYASRRCS